ncbi:hypothetical protein HDU67_005248, partial [Dinochytrium kinnereticum]
MDEDKLPKLIVQDYWEHIKASHPTESTKRIMYVNGLLPKRAPKQSREYTTAADNIGYQSEADTPSDDTNLDPEEEIPPRVSKSSKKKTKAHRKKKTANVPHGSSSDARTSLPLQNADHTDDVPL